MQLVYAVGSRLYGALLFTLLYLAMFAIMLVVAFVPFFVLILTIPPYQHGGWFLLAFAVVYPVYGIALIPPMGKVCNYWIDLQQNIVRTYQL